MPKARNHVPVESLTGRRLLSAKGSIPVGSTESKLTSAQQEWNAQQAAKKAASKEKESK